MFDNSNNGFTLVEIAIVLVIIGLIVGGILVGKDLIEAASIRNIISQNQNFVSQWNTFKLKYNCLPGDCSNATDLFGVSSACPTPRTTATCNGNGDRWVDWSSGAESRLVWNHMALANLIGYGFLNLQGVTANYDNAYYALPPFYPLNVGFIVGSTGNYNLAQMYSTGTGNNAGTSMRGIGLQTTMADSLTYGYAPRAAIEYSKIVSNIDTKIDDGIPATGKFQASGGRKYDTGTTLTCITGSNQTSSYDLTQTEPTCRYIYNLEQ